MLQAYQTDLLRDLDKGESLFPDQVAELRRTTGLSPGYQAGRLCQAQDYGGHGGGGETSVDEPGRHREERKGFLLDAQVSPSELFGISVETVIEKFGETKAHSAAFRSFVPRRSRSEPEQHRGPGLSRSEDQRRAQKASVATHAPPPPAGRVKRNCGSQGGKQNLRDVIQTRQRSRLSQSDTEVSTRSL